MELAAAVRQVRSGILEAERRRNREAKAIAGIERQAGRVALANEPGMGAALADLRQRHAEASGHLQAYVMAVARLKQQLAEMTGKPLDEADPGDIGGKTRA